MHLRHPVDTADVRSKGVGSVVVKSSYIDTRIVLTLLYHCLLIPLLFGCIEVLLIDTLITCCC